MDILLASAKSPDPFLKLVDLLEQGEKVALIILLETSGSTPQVAGAKAVVISKGLVSGTIGGGAFELTMVERAKKLLLEEEAKLFDWSFACDSEEGSLCGGRALVLLDGHPHKNYSVFKEIVRCLNQREKGWFLIFIEKPTSEKVEVSSFFFKESRALVNFVKNRINKFEGTLSFFGEKEAFDSWREEKPCLLKVLTRENKEAILFLEPICPLPRLLIFGAGHVGQAVAKLGLFLGFEVYLFDDRKDIELPMEIKDKINFILSDMASSLEQFPTDESCYLIIVTRGHRHDAEVLRLGLKKKLAYIGMIGSRRKVALMKEEFLEKGWASEEDWARLHSPIGLNIGAKTVEEIALSIMAEVIACRRQKEGEKR